MPEPYQQALQLLRDLGAERALVLQGPEPLKVRAAYGLREDQPWTDQISLSLLQKSLGEGECLLLGDAQTSTLADRWSLAVSEIRSVLCVPFWSPSSRIVGILYADTRSRAGVFGKKAMETMQACARNLERALYGGSQAQAVPVPPPPPGQERAYPSGSLGLRPARPDSRAEATGAAASPRETPRAEKPRASLRGGRPDGRQVTVFYRSLATMVSAGLPIGRCLDILGRHCDNAVLQAVVSSVAGRVLAGSTISAALTLHPRIFSRFETRLVQLGEKTGRLHHVLDNLARHREKGEETRLKLQSALVYPALVLVLCLTLLILGPPYLLEGQFRLIREAHQPIPWITRVLMFVSDLVRSPVGLLALGVTALGVVLLARLAWSRETWRLAAWHQAMRWPGLRRTLQTLATARFARSLALSYRVGLPVTEGFVLAAQSSRNPVLEGAIPEAVEAVKNGSSLASALASIGFFPNLFVQSLRAAEEAGNVDGLMEWTARLYEVELESALDSFLSLIEPLLMLGLGILVGFVLLATLLPMVHVLESLS